MRERERLKERERKTGWKEAQQVSSRDGDHDAADVASLSLSFLYSFFLFPSFIPSLSPFSIPSLSSFSIISRYSLFLYLPFVLLSLSISSLNLLVALSKTRDGEKERERRVSSARRTKY